MSQVSGKGFTRVTAVLAALLAIHLVPRVASGQDSAESVFPDYTVCAEFGPDGPDPELSPPISRPPELLNARDMMDWFEQEGKRLSREGETGSSPVWFLVDAEGELRDVRLGRSTGSANVDAAILRAAKRMEFVSATLNGEPVCTWFARIVRLG